MSCWLMPFTLLLAIGVASAFGVPRGQPQHQWYMDNVQPHRLTAEKNSAYPPPSFATQMQDHFDDSNKITWHQAYYVNDTFWEGPNGDAPIFLCVGGEGPPIDGSAVVNSVHCNIAVEMLQEKKALMFALEHRYYGCHNMSACPVQDLSTKDSLKYLSSSQAIEDIKHFVEQMNLEYKLSSANKWVTWGGSYPGILAGWSRLAHPELIHAAVASSAPVQAQLDMYEYNDAVARAYTVDDNNVGGSEACRLAIATGHRQLEKLLETSDGIAKAESLLGFSKGDLGTRRKQQEQLGMGAANFPAQENDPACEEPACNIKKICAIMRDESHGDELHRIAAVKSAQAQAAPMLQASELPDFWFWQTCTEFGFYQTCKKNSGCMFPQITDVESMAGGCASWGINISDIEKSIEATNTKHGGSSKPLGADGTLGTCVVWPNGEVDPWATLSVLKSPGPLQIAVWVPGASHHAWTHPSASSDQVSVKKARTQIRLHVNSLLNQSECTVSTAAAIVV
jgi:hypothetical protein